MIRIRYILYGIVVALVFTSSVADAAYDFGGSSGDYAEINSSPISGSESYSVAGWVKTSDVTNGLVPFWIGDKDDIARYGACQLNGNVAGDPATAVLRQSTTLDAETSTGYSADTWTHIACTLTYSSGGNDTVIAYIDGGDSGTDNAAISDATWDRVSLGRYADSTPCCNYDGLLAYWAVWNVVLTSGEVATLAAGGCPTSTQGASIVAYWPMQSDGSGTIEDEDTGTYDLTISGTVTFDGADNPSVSCGTFVPTIRS